MLQTKVNTTLAIGITGEFYDDSPRRVSPYQLNGATPNVVGYAFTTKDATPEEATAGGAGLFAGILVSPKELVRQGLDASMTVVNGTIGSLCTMGHVFVNVDVAVKVGFNAFYVTATGKITGALAETLADATPIVGAKFVFVNAEAGETAILQLN